jgi:predicted nucleic acid-binding protein
MILVDTNVISEPLKPQPDPKVVAWFNLQIPDDLCICSITVMEMLDGVSRLPIGQRRTSLDRSVNNIIPRFKCLPFDEFAARSYAQLMETARQAGYTVSMADAQIAAVAHSNGVTTFATRDVGPFSAMGLKVVNPFV